MFNSRRRSRPGPANGLLPSTTPDNVNRNALAAASAIGNALKTGTPIPRSNSLQRSGSFHRSSFLVPSESRSGSLIGLQTPPQQFQEHNYQAIQRRSQSLSDKPKPKPIRPNSSIPGKPRMIKKHVPGPYGLITIEVPAEEEPPKQPSTPKYTVRRSNSSQKLTRPLKTATHSDNGSIRSSGSRKPIFEEPLKEIEEDEPLKFERTAEDRHEFRDFELSPKKDLTFIEEEATEIDSDEKVTFHEGPEEFLSEEDALDREFEELKVSKDSDEAGFQNNIQYEESEKQNELNEKRSSYSESANPYIDEDSDGPPSTAKSNDSYTTPGQSSFTTEESEHESKPHHVSMAQQLRPTIPLLVVNKDPQSPSQPDLRPTSSYEAGTANSSIYSGEPASESERTDDQDSLIPARSDKRSAPIKSALKIKSSSSVNLPDGKNPANEAYLSLATAQNTRLNALPSNASTTSSNRSRTNNFRNSAQPQPNAAKRSPPPPQQPPQNSRHLPHSSKSNGFQERPVSSIEPRTNSIKNKVSPQRPQSSQGFRSQNQKNYHQPPPQYQYQQQQQQASPLRRAGSLSSTPKPYTNNNSNQPPVYKSASNAAALNASIKKPEPPKLQRSSSFEREKQQGGNSAFKRKSLRDPSFNPHPTPESNLGFYRHQAQQQQQHHQKGPQHHPQQQQHSPQHQQPSNFTGFNSRFNDSDSDLDVPIGKPLGKTISKPQAGLAPPQPHSDSQTLRKPRSHYTLRSPSVNVISETSPAKSLPEKRATRYFSESDKERLFNEHKKVEAVKEEKKKGAFGKLKKLFGRSKD